MAIPTLHISISGDVVAFYGAIVATITATAQIIAHLRDRARIKLTLQKDMEIIGDPGAAGMTFTIVNVTNVGRRPVTIRNVGAYRLFPRSPFITPDCRPQCPYELTEGKQMTAMLNQSEFESGFHNSIEYWWATDATGREHRLNIAPWHTRWLSSRRRLKKARREEKERLEKKLKENKSSRV